MHYGTGLQLLHLRDTRQLELSTGYHVPTYRFRTLSFYLYTTTSPLHHQASPRPLTTKTLSKFVVAASDIKKAMNE
jgi:hypothetical protein